MTRRNVTPRLHRTQPTGRQRYLVQITLADTEDSFIIQFPCADEARARHLATLAMDRGLPVKVIDRNGGRVS